MSSPPPALQHKSQKSWAEVSHTRSATGIMTDSQKNRVEQSTRGVEGVQRSGTETFISLCSAELLSYYRDATQTRVPQTSHSYSRQSPLLSRSGNGMSQTIL